MPCTESGRGERVPFVRPALSFVQEAFPEGLDTGTDTHFHLVATVLQNAHTLLAKTSVFQDLGEHALSFQPHGSILYLQGTITPISA